MVVTLHDLIPLKRRGEYLRTGLRFRLRYLAVQRAVRVIVPTNAVADDAMHELGHPARADRRDPRGGGARAVGARSDARGGGRARALRAARAATCCGSAACARPTRASASPRWPGRARTMPLVLVGPTGRWARELPDVTLTGAVSDDELAAIYTGAHALVFPSDDEGFGLPPVEALACGTPGRRLRRPGAARGARRPRRR